MANLNKINKEYEEILLGLSFEEIVAYYRNINKKMLETYPTLNSNKWKNKEHKKLFDSIEEVTDIFKKDFPLINVVNYITKFEELEDKYLAEHDLAVYKLLTSDIVTLSISIDYLVNSILADFSSIYIYYDYITHIGAYVLKVELDVPEELLEPLKPYFNNRNNSSFYGAKAISYLNDNIEVNFKIVEMYIEAFNDFNKINFNPEDVPEELIKVFNIYNNAYDSGVKAIETFKELKETPFKRAIEVEAKARTKNNFFNYTEEEIEEFIETKLASAPNYNFNEFKLDLPNKNRSY